MPTRILMHGSRGRMGQAILALARQNPDFEVTGEMLAKRPEMAADGYKGFVFESAQRAAEVASA